MRPGDRPRLPGRARVLPRIALRGSDASAGMREVPEEVPIAFAYGGCTQAVMMATPCNLEDFAIGFSLTEGIVERPGEIEALNVIMRDNGIALAMSLTADRMDGLWQRRRHLAGPSGCGLCGIESIAEAVRPCRAVEATRRFDVAEVEAAITSLSAAQELHRITHATHAAGFWRREDGLVSLREDVGRHNALDKLAGALAQRGIDGTTGMVCLTSRVSVEMVQKAAAIGCGLIAAVSAPTALAARLAHACGMTLIAVARRDGFEIFAHPERVLLS